MLYEKAAKIETRIENVSYDGNPAKVNANRLLEVTDKLKKAPQVRVVQINPFRAFTSGLDRFENVIGVADTANVRTKCKVKKVSVLLKVLCDYVADKMHSEADREVIYLSFRYPL